MAVDPGTAAIVASSLLLAKEPLNKLLGPSLDYFGKELESFAKKRAENIGRILQIAINKLGSKINEPGQVHPKLLKCLISDGSFCDDELTAEYYGGVLASSRTGVIRDDRGVTYLDQLSRFSTYQIRTHFILYTVLRNIFIDRHLKPSLASDRNSMQVFIPYSSYKRAMAFAENNEDDVDFYSYFVHSFKGLESNGLIDNLSFGDCKFLKESVTNLTFPEGGSVYEPSLPGISFYLWGTGHGNYQFDSFLTNEITIEVPKSIEIPNNAFSLREEIQRQKKATQSKS